jgi:hypothetical protein
LWNQQLQLYPNTMLARILSIMPIRRANALQWAATLPAVSEESLWIFATAAALSSGESGSFLMLWCSFAQS